MVYQIPCQDCSWSYIGETGRSLKTRKSEHVRNVKQNKKGSNVAKHAWTQDHVIHLFTNSDAILNHDALWVIQGKNPNSKAFNVVLRHNTIIFFYKHFLEDNEAVSINFMRTLLKLFPFLGLTKI